MLPVTREFYAFFRSPETTGIYWTPQLEAAWLALKDLIDQKLGVVALLGMTGVGKSYLANKLKAEAQREDSRCLVAVSKVPEKGSLHFNVTLSELARDFALTDRKKIAFRFDEVERFLRQCLERDTHPVLVIDQAHRLRPSYLEALRLLVDLEMATEEATRKLITIVLIAQPKLRWTLRTGGLETVQWRVHEVWVETLGRHFDEYVDWVITQCGGDARILSPEARRDMQRYVLFRHLVRSSTSSRRCSTMGRGGAKRSSRRRGCVPRPPRTPRTFSPRATASGFRLPT